MPEPLSVKVVRRVGTFTLDVAFTVSQWPAVLFGPSGAGKTMLLRVLAGLDRADPSSVTLGTERQETSRAGGNVQLVAQRPALFPHLSVAGNVAFGISRLPAAERRARVDDMLCLLGAEHLADRRPDHLSGGERQRVAIARALAPRPRLLLLDEAFAGLDSAARQDLLSRLTGLLRQQQVAALYVTHEVGDAFALGAEVIVLQHGRIARQGPAADALAEERERLLSSLHAVPTSVIVSRS